MVKFAMRKFMIVAALSLIVWAIAPAKVNAAILDKIHTRNYTLNEEYVDVTETFSSTITSARYMIPQGTEETFNIFNPVLDDPQARAKIDQTLPTIAVTDQTGATLPFTTEIDGQNILVKVAYPRNLLFGQTQTINMTYKSYALSHRSGAIYDIYIPSFSSDFQFTNDTTNLTINSKLTVPKSLGELNFYIPDKAPTDTGSAWEFNFTQDDLKDVISWVQIGTKQNYQFEIRQPYKASSSIPLFYNTYSVTLPRDIVDGPVTQEVLFTNISPQPDSVNKDADGNLIAQFAIPANESGEIVIKGFASLQQYKDFALAQAGTLSDIPTAMAEQYTSAATYWEVDAQPIQDAAAQIKGEDTDVFSLISKAYAYVIDQIDYSEVKRFGIIIPNERQGALKTLQGGAAVCMEYSDLFIALMRAMGIPARAAFGYGYDSRSTGGTDIAHQWAEVYLPAQDTWIGVDTTWGEAGPEIIGGDLNHFYKYVASQDPNTPPPVEVAFFGNIDAVPEENFSIDALAEIPAGTEYSTASQLQEQYPLQSGVAQAANNVGRSISLAARTIDSHVTSWLNTIMQSNDTAVQIFRILIYISPFALLFLLFAIRYARKRRKRKPAVAAKLN